MFTAWDAQKIGVTLDEIRGIETRAAALLPEWFKPQAGFTCQWDGSPFVYLGAGVGGPEYYLSCWGMFLYKGEWHFIDILTLNKEDFRPMES